MINNLKCIKSNENFRAITSFFYHPITLTAAILFGVSGLLSLGCVALNTSYFGAISLSSIGLCISLILLYCSSAGKSYTPTNVMLIVSSSLMMFESVFGIVIFVVCFILFAILWFILGLLTLGLLWGVQPDFLSFFNSFSVDLSLLNLPLCAVGITCIIFTAGIKKSVTTPLIKRNCSIPLAVTSFVSAFCILLEYIFILIFRNPHELFSNSYNDSQIALSIVVMTICVIAKAVALILLGGLALRYYVFADNQSRLKAQYIRPYR